MRKVADFAEAQRLSPFAVLYPAGVDAGPVTVRPEGPEFWGTIRFELRTRAAMVRIKEFFFDWGFSHGDPTNLSAGSWLAYETPVSFPVQDRFVGFYGTDYNGKEAGFVLMYDTNVEIETIEREVGIEGMRRLMDSLRPVDRSLAERIEETPFAWKSYHVRMRRPPWSSMPEVARMDWFVDPRELERRTGWRIDLDVDSIGVWTDPADDRWEIGCKVKEEPRAMFHFVTTEREERRKELRRESIPDPERRGGLEPELTHVEDLDAPADVVFARYGDLPPFGPGGAYLEGPHGIMVCHFAPARGFDRGACKRAVLAFFRALSPPKSQ